MFRRSIVACDWRLCTPIIPLIPILFILPPPRGGFLLYEDHVQWYFLLTYLHLCVWCPTSPLVLADNSKNDSDLVSPQMMEVHHTHEVSPQMMEVSYLHIQHLRIGVQAGTLEGAQEMWPEILERVKPWQELC